MRGDFTKLDSYEPKFVHPKYAPFPTAFYAAVFRHFKRNLQGKPPYTLKDRLLVISEDLRNPSIEFFRKLQNIGFNISFRIGQALVQDLHLLTCSKNVAISNGSFWTLFSFFRSPQLHVFTMDCNVKSPYSYPQNSVFYTISSRKERMIFSRKMKIWRNSAFQRHVVDKFYEIIECS